ncbi:MAG: PorT family protein [Bacteroidales bacterium]|nr:PorT family protein [Bacteroidales bacterium]
MRKVFIPVLATLMMLAGTSMSAQNLSIEAGFGMSNTNFNVANFYKANADLFGGTVGLNYRVPLAVEGLGFDTGLIFAYFTKSGVDVFAKISGEALSNVAFTEEYLQVPLNLDFRIPMSDDLSLMILAGPTLDLGLSSTVKEKSSGMRYRIYDGMLSDFTKYRRFDVLIGGGLAFDVMDAVRFSVRYDYGLVNRNGGNFTGGVLKIHRSQLKLGVGFLF